jgi:formyl-CoA transferase
MAAAIERPDLLRDDRFTTRDLRIKNYGELTRLLGEIIGGKPRAHWMQVLEENDVPFAPINDLAEVPDDPQVRHLGTFYQQRHPTEGEITAIHRPVLIDGERAERVLPAPTLGEHTDAILAELGYDANEIAALRAASVI